MNQTSDPSPDLASQVARLRENLNEFPAGTADAGEALLRSREPSHIAPLIAGVLSYLAPKTTAPHQAALLTADGDNLRLVEDFQIDSLTMIELAFLVEDSLAIKLPDVELANLNTLAELKQMLEQQLGPVA